MFQYGFCDLCVNVDGVDKKFVSSVCKRLRLSGFRTIALNVTLSDDAFKTTKKKKGKRNNDSNKDVIPEPFSIQIEDVRDLNLLSRLTIHISDPSQLFQLKRSPNFNKYDLIAVVPMNENIFQQVCGVNDVDIISFIPESKLPYRLTRKFYNMAVDKSIFFELPYGPAVLDSTCRRNIIYTSHQYFTLGKSKNIVITSSSSYPYNSIRGPYDIVNLALMFGLNDVIAKQTISKNCTELIYKAEARRRKKSCLTSIKLLPSETGALDNELSDVESPLKKIKLNEEMEVGN